MVDIFGNTISNAYTSGYPVSKIYSLGTLVWERSTPPTPTDIKAIKFTCVDEPSTSGGKLGFRAVVSGQSLYWYPNLEWSRDGETWYDWNHDNYGLYDDISVRKNQSLYVRGDCQYTGLDTMNYGQFTMSSTTGKFNCEGNIMYLLDYEQDLTVIPNSYCFYKLFSNCTGLVDASGLLLSATTMKQHCYECMFKGCTELESSPKLLANNLVGFCYFYMFEDCTSLTEIWSYNNDNIYWNNTMNDILKNASPTGTIYTTGRTQWDYVKEEGYIPSGWTITTITS